MLSDSYQAMTRWLDLMAETISATGDLYQEARTLATIGRLLECEDARDRFDAVFERLVRDLEECGARLDTGSLGTKRCSRCSRGTARANSPTGSPRRRSTQLGYWVTRGVTASWEAWSNFSPEQTLDHTFLATVEDWFHQHSRGSSRPCRDTRPRESHRSSPTTSTVSPRASRPPHGVVSSSWIRDADGIVLTVAQPLGVTTEIVVPYGREFITVQSGAVEALSVVDAPSQTFRASSSEVVLRLG